MSRDRETIEIEETTVVKRQVVNYTCDSCGDKEQVLDVPGEKAKGWWFFGEYPEMIGATPFILDLCPQCADLLGKKIINKNRVPSHG